MDGIFNIPDGVWEIWCGMQKIS